MICEQYGVENEHDPLTRKGRAIFSDQIRLPGAALSHFMNVVREFIASASGECYDSADLSCSASKSDGMNFLISGSCIR